MSYIGREPQIGNFQMCDAISVVNGQASYTMQVGGVAVIPGGNFNVIASVNGVVQKAGSSFTISSSTITFSQNLVTGDVIDFILILGSVLDLGVPSDGTVTTGKIADNAVTTDKLAIANANTTTGNVRINDKTGDQTEGNPQYTFSSNTGTGMRRASSDTIAFDTGSTERVKIDSSGVTAAVQFMAGAFVGNGSGHGVRIKDISSSRGEIGIEKTGTSLAGMIYFYNGNGGVGSISTDGSATAYNTSSDYRLKENVDYTFNATSRLKQLKPARFNFIADANKTVDGFLAHEVSSVVPEAVTGEKDGTEIYLDDNGDEQTKPLYQGIDQSKLVPLLVKTIQELEARITELENA